MFASVPPELLAQCALVLVLWLAARRFAADFSRQLSGLRQARPPSFTPTAPPVRGLSGVPELVLGCADTYTPAPPWGTCTYQPPSLCTYRRRRAACPQGVTHCAPGTRARLGRAGTCCATLARQALGALEGATHSWGQASWNTQRLRDGPDYKRNRIKRPALPPLLPCVGLDAFRTR